LGGIVLGGIALGVLGSAISLGCAVARVIAGLLLAIFALPGVAAAAAPATR
jgi:hypothetical protein